MNNVSVTAAAQANHQQQTELIAQRSVVQVKQQHANQVAQQAQQAQRQVQATPNPSGIGTRVDTHA